MGVKYNHTKFEQETQRWRPGTEGLGLGSRERFGGRVRSRLMVGVGIRVKVGFKDNGQNGQCKVDKMGKGNEKKFSGAFGATICMASSC